MPLVFDKWTELQAVERAGGKFVSISSLLQIATERGKLIAREGMVHTLDSNATEFLRGRFAELQSLITALEEKNAISNLPVDE